MVVLPGKGRDNTLSIPAQHPVDLLSPPPARLATITPESLLEHAFAHPIGGLPLSDLARPPKKILIIVDDITRTTPTAAVVPALMAYLARSGCREEDLSFAVALGTHRIMSDDELARKLGRGVAGRFPVANTRADERGAFVASGRYWNDTPVEVHRAVMEADLLITIGSVVPHTEAGWSGGCKMVLPGMCSERTVMLNHVLAASYPGNALGTETTPVRQNMEALIAGLRPIYSVNLVMTPDGQITGAFGGDVVAAQRAAVAEARRIYSVPYRERADLVISNAYPADGDLWQASKGIWAGDLLVKPGGTVLLFAECFEGIGPHPEFLEYLQCPAEELEASLNSLATADRIAAAIALPVVRMLSHLRLVIVSPGLPAAAFARGPILYFADLQEAVDACLAPAMPPSGAPARVGVLTHGGYTFPMAIA